MASLFKDWSGAVTDKREAGPINGECLIAEFFQKAEFGLAEGGPFISPFGEMLVQAFISVIANVSSAGSETCDDRFAAGQKEGTFKASYSLLAEQLATAGVARGESDQFGMKRKITNFTDLQQTVLSRIR